MLKLQKIEVLTNELDLFRSEDEERTPKLQDWKWNLEDQCYEGLATGSPSATYSSADPPGLCAHATQLGELLFLARRSSGLSLQELSRKLRLPAKTLLALESGAKWPTIHVLQDLAEATGRPLTWFFTGWWPALGRRMVACLQTHDSALANSGPSPARDAVEDGFIEA